VLFGVISDEAISDGFLISMKLPGLSTDARLIWMLRLPLS